MDDESSDGDYDEEMPIEIKVKRQEMNEWNKFCKEKISKIEKVWNRKLEDSSTGEDGSSDEDGEGDGNKSKEEEDDNLSDE